MPVVDTPVATTRVLRVEAVNISATVFDVDQLSAVRGGNLILRTVLAQCGEWLRQRGLLAVRDGGEAILFAFPSNASDEDTIRVRTELLEKLRSSPLAAHFCLQVQVIEAVEDTEASMAAVRWSQLRSPSAPAEPLTRGSGARPCGLTKVRAATATVEVRGDSGSVDKPVCDSAKARHDYGRAVKDHIQVAAPESGALQRFYVEQAAAPPGSDPATWSNKVQALAFSQDLQQLSTNGPFQQLDGKLAVLSLDGNSFGHRQKMLPSELRSGYDEVLQKWRSQLLGVLLDWLAFAEEPEKAIGQLRNHVDAYQFGGTARSRIRMEVLRWSGDEIVLFLPAWLALEALGKIFAENLRWEYGEGKQKQRFTLSAGVLFCHHKLPIKRAIDLSEKILQRAKRAAKDFNPQDPPASWDYLILESLDYPAAQDLETFWNRRTRNQALQRSALGVDPDYPKTLETLRERLTELPHRKIYAAARLEMDPTGLDAHDLMAWRKTEQARETEQVAGAFFQTINSAAPAFPWFHLCELLAYIDPVSEATP